MVTGGTDVHLVLVDLRDSALDGQQAEDLLAQIGSSDSVKYIQAAAAVQKLIHQHEMGELFKVIAFGKDIDIDWTGFSHGDICHKL